MGQQFSVSKLKVNLKMAGSRMQMAMQKKQNQSRITKKQIADLLGNGKEESARIRVEGVIRDERSVYALEFVSLMCELLSQRIQMIETTTKCPQDLLEACATVIYSANRLQIPELTEIATQLGMKYGVEWARSHLDNRSGMANNRVVQWLGVAPPSIEDILTALQKIADENNVAWSAPKMVAPVPPNMATLDPTALEREIVAQQNAAARGGQPMPPAQPGGGMPQAMPMPPMQPMPMPPQQPMPMPPQQPMPMQPMPMPPQQPMPMQPQPGPAPMMPMQPQQFPPAGLMSAPAPAGMPMGPAEQFQPPPAQPNAFQPGMAGMTPTAAAPHPADTTAGKPSGEAPGGDDYDLDELKKRFENLKK